MIRTVVAPFSPEPERLAAVREALPALGAGIYLNTGSVGPLPAETAAAMAEIAVWERDVGRGHQDDFPELLQRMAEARAAVASLLTTDPAAIALTHSTTDGINAALLALDLRPGDHIVTTQQEHAGVTGPIAAARGRGVEATYTDIGDGGDDARTLAAIEAAITPRTRVVAVSHVLWTTGAVLPVTAIGELARRHGAAFVLDGAQAAGAMPVAFEATGADFYALAGQKWLLGPEGTGALAIGPAAIERYRPALGSWFSFERIDQTGTAELWPDARRFEGAGVHRPSIVGFARSVAWLQMFVGIDWVYRRGLATARAAAERLAAIPGVDVLTPVHQMATLVTFTIDGWNAAEAFAELGSRVFAIIRTIDALDALRISVGFFTSEDELERFANAVELLAAHTPGTLPPRPTLTILGA